MLWEGAAHANIACVARMAGDEARAQKHFEREAGAALRRGDYGCAFLRLRLSGPNWVCGMTMTEPGRGCTRKGAVYHQPSEENQIQISLCSNLHMRYTSEVYPCGQLPTGLKIAIWFSSEGWW